MSFQASFECYSALDQLQPRLTRTIVSNFKCEVKEYVLGVWVQKEGTLVEPYYLTQEQLDNLVVVKN